MYLPTLREDPKDADIESHKLLLRAGMIRMNVSGIYTFLPLGFRVLKKIEKITREEMDRAGYQETLLSAIQPKELWEKSGRWDTFGPEMFKLKDRNDREFCLGPTHEEYFTDLIKDEVKSYKQLPVHLYQIQTKYRDEKRPRFGVIRAREFIMKDGYSFDKDVAGMDESYKVMWEAYEKIFDRMNIDYKIVEGDSGAMGGSDSHEFIAIAESGEGVIAYSDSSDYAATDEKAKVVIEVDESGEPLEIEEIHTPDVKSIEEVGDFLGEGREKLVKTLVYEIDGEPVFAIIPGNRELNETKFFNALGVSDFEIEIASDETIKKATGSEAGFIGPVGLNGDYKVLVDERVTRMKNIIVGANKKDYHIKNVNYGRDFEGIVVDDLLLVEEGDKDPLSDGKLHLDRGIEVGNIFKLGTKYSKSLEFSYLDENGKAKDVYMGSYGVGISRLVAAIVEQHHDEDGIIWPISIAPFEIIITLIKENDEDQVKLSEELYEYFTEEGFDVLMDDRKERPGVKFKDRDLIGIPYRITVGKRASEGIVEFSNRSEKINEEIDINELKSRLLSDSNK